MMNLVDAVSGARLAGFTTVAMLMFMVTFAAIVAWACTRPRDQIEQWRRSPLDED
jgi:hypothetical protein